MTGLGERGSGGAFVLRDGEFEPVDRISSTGVALSPDGLVLARLLWDDDDLEACGELVLYSSRGMLLHRRIHSLLEAHGALWHDGHLLVVSTGSNSVLWLDRSGRVRHRWSAPGEGDCWHLNNLLVVGGRVMASAFGRFERCRGWNEPGVRAGRGIVFDLASGENLLQGLNCPHDPVAIDDGWLVCNSGDGQLLRCAADGAVLERRDLGGWTRGLAYDGERLYVGVSAHRMLQLDGQAAVAVLDRETLEERDRFALPCREVFAVALVPETLISGITRGAATLLQFSEKGLAADRETIPRLLDASPARGSLRPAARSG